MMLELVELLVAYHKMKAAQRQIDETVFKELTRIIDKLKKMNKDQELSEIISNIQGLHNILTESFIP